MTTSAGSVVFRVSGLPEDEAEGTVVTLRSVITAQLSPLEEETLRYDITAIPACDEEHASAALVDFKNGIPAFLTHLVENQLDDWAVETEVGDINFDRHFFGFTQLYYSNPGQSVTADIIALTGLDGHAYGSWKGRGNLSRMWLRHFLSKDMPNCRTLIYGYNSRLSHRGTGTIMTYGLEFMESLKRIRNTPELRQRPIFFIAHSLGGIILAHSLVKAKQTDEADHPTIAMLHKATYGILFFATPHKGLVIEDIRSMIISEEAHPRLGLLQELDGNSTHLLAQLADFKNLIRDRKIVSFFETGQTRRLEWNSITKTWGRTGQYVTAVDTESAMLHLPSQIETRIPLHSDHSNIVKFDNKNALGYKFALEKLKEFEIDAPKVVSDRFKARVTPDKQPIFAVPFNRDAKFIGRKDVIQEIEEKFEAHSRIALCGIGGIGKSQIAIEYCYIWKEKHPKGHVLWIHASTQDRFEEAYRNIARDMSLPGLEGDDINIMKLVQDWLNKEENGPWLFVLDSADDIELFFGSTADQASASIGKSKGVAELLPRSPNGSLLITTRDKRVGQRLNGREDIVMVPAFGLADAEQLLRVKASQIDDLEMANSHKLLQILGYIPLAITQAAAFITENCMTIATYLDDLSKGDTDLEDYLEEDLPDPWRDPASGNSVIKTWKLSFDQIAKQKPRAAEMLSLMAVLDRHAIPKSLLKQDGERSIEFNKAVGTLQAFSLIKTERGGSIFEVHRLVHLSTQKWLKIRGMLNDWQEKALNLVAEVLPSGDFSTWREFEILLPHAKSVVRHEYSSRLIVLQRANILESLATYDENQGRYHSACRIWDEVQRTRATFLGQEDPDTIAAMAGLALALKKNGKHHEAIKLNRQLLELKERIFGLEHPRTLSTINNLVLALLKQNNLKEAEQLTRRALECTEKLGLEHPDMILSMHLMAVLLYRQERSDESEQLNRRVLALRKKLLGPDHPDTITTMNNLALTLRKQEKYTEAEEIDREVLEWSEKALGPQHPRTLATMFNLAVILERLGKDQESTQLHQEVLEKRKEGLGLEHPSTLKSLSTVGSLLEDQYRHEEAERIHRQVLELRRKVLGLEHRDTILSMSKLAKSIWSQDRHEEAENMYRQALELREKILGPGHPETLRIVHSIACILHHRRRYEEAKALFVRAHIGFHESLGPHHADTVSCMADYTSMLDDLDG